MYPGIAVVVKHVMGKTVRFGVFTRAYKHEILAALRNILFLMSE
jgi:hypothetical protein